MSLHHQRISAKPLPSADIFKTHIQFRAPPSGLDKPITQLRLLFQQHRLRVYVGKYNGCSTVPVLSHKGNIARLLFFPSVNCTTRSQVKLWGTWMSPCATEMIELKYQTDAIPTPSWKEDRSSKERLRLRLILKKENYVFTNTPSLWSHLAFSYKCLHAAVDSCHWWISCKRTEESWAESSEAAIEWRPGLVRIASQGAIH
jgi:hypothetical protein